LKVNMIKDEGKELVLEFETMEFTIPDLLADELLEDSGVEFAGASKDHPETGKPVLVIRAKKDPKASLVAAIGRIDDNLSELKAQVLKKK
jgi:DNA-directed RNA polymerase subunit L